MWGHFIIECEKLSGDCVMCSSPLPDWGAFAQVTRGPGDAGEGRGYLSHPELLTSCSGVFSAVAFFLITSSFEGPFIH